MISLPAHPVRRPQPAILIPGERHPDITASSSTPSFWGRRSRRGAKARRAETARMGALCVDSVQSLIVEPVIYRMASKQISLSSCLQHGIWLKYAEFLRTKESTRQKGENGENSKDWYLVC